MEGQSVALLLIAAALPVFAGSPDAEEVLRRMVEAEKRNRQQAAYFVYREDIRTTVSRDGETPRRLSWVTSEVTVLEGELYHRVVGRDGQPLSAAERDAEDRRMQKVAAYRRTTPIEQRRKRYFEAEEHRYQLDPQLVVDHHRAWVAGETDLDGHRVWLVETEPKENAPKPKRRSEWALVQRIKYWVDQHSFLPLRVEAEQTRNFADTRKGDQTRLESLDLDGTILQARTTNTSRRKDGRSWVVTVLDQEYSNYQRFRVNSMVVFDDLGSGRF